MGDKIRETSDKRQNMGDKMRDKIRDTRDKA